MGFVANSATAAVAAINIANYVDNTITVWVEEKMIVIRRLYIFL